MGPNETAEIRRALDRLQQSFEVLNDRYRDMRRERKQLRERIDELHREREMTETATSAQLEMARQDRQRAAELEDRLHGAESRNEELFNRIADLERVIAERESFIAEQEDALARLREAMETGRRQEEERWIESERVRAEAEELRNALGAVRAESERYRSQLDQIAAVGEGEVAIPAAALEQIRSEAASLRQLVAQLQQDRVDMEGKHLQAIGKLDAATLAEAMARTEVAGLLQEKESIEGALASLREAYGRLEEKLVEREGALGESAEGNAERELARERELQDLHAALQRRQEAHAAEVAQLEERLAAAELELERMERHAADLRLERDTARQAVESAKVQLHQFEAGDDERLSAQRARIEQLTADVNHALDVAARKEVEAARIAQDLEEAQSRLARMEEELELLRNREEGGNGIATALPALNDEERRQITEQIDTAIRLIDRHLQDEG